MEFPIQQVTKCLYAEMEKFRIILFGNSLNSSCLNICFCFSMYFTSECINLYEFMFDNHPEINPET